MLLKTKRILSLVQFLARDFFKKKFMGENTKGKNSHRKIILVYNSLASQGLSNCFCGDYNFTSLRSFWYSEVANFILELSVFIKHHECTFYF